jgi:hypothetical protein
MWSGLLQSYHHANFNITMHIQPITIPLAYAYVQVHIYMQHIPVLWVQEQMRHTEHNTVS